MSLDNTIKLSLEKEATSPLGADPSRVAENGLAIVRDRIGKEAIARAYETLQRYKSGKANLERKIIENEEWFKLRHWQQMGDRKSEIEPTSAWLLNSIMNKHASAMDNYPSPNILPREEQDKAQAETLSAVIPVVLEQNDFEKVYSDAWYYFLKTGSMCYAVYWDNSLHNGLGDVSVACIDLLNLFWEPGITDIQKSKNVFHLELCDNESLERAYPILKNKLGGSEIDIAKYNYDDNVDTANKSVVVDWYYKKQDGTKTVLHYCKFVGDTVLFATENDPDLQDEGWYADGNYPFVIERCLPVSGTPAGIGYIDIAKDSQAYIDRLGQAMLENAFNAVRPRSFVPEGAGINEDEYRDTRCSLVHCKGSVDGIHTVKATPLPSIYYQLMMGKIDELKETTGNRDVNTGGTTSGVTAASALAAMQEAGAKLDRDSNKTGYRAFKKIVTLCIERIRQFYTEARFFRITGKDGLAQFISYDNSGIVMARQEDDGAGEESFNLPLFDVEVTAQKASPYSKMAQNELALQFYNAGLFEPSRSDQALACLEFMDFDRKSFVMERVRQNGTMYEMLISLQQEMVGLAAKLDQITGTNLTGSLMQRFTMTAGSAPASGADPEALRTASGEGESSVTEKARQRVAESTSPT